MKIKQYICVLLAFYGAAAHAQDIQIRSFPAPETVSAEMRPLVTSAPFSYWRDRPETAQAWRSWVAQLAQGSAQRLAQLREKLRVSVEPGRLADVPVFIVTPRQISAENQGRVLLHFHGGGYVLNPGEAGTDEAIMMAGYGKIKVISVDYRMAPDFPFPAAIDDAVAAYREILKEYPPEKIGVFGTSTGGGMTLALLLRAKAERLPLPAAAAAGTPWTDMTKTGDSYFTHEGIDNVLVSYDGWLGAAAAAYANGRDLKDPLLSPVYGNVDGFPPTLLISGTRDLFLSNTVRMHLKLRDAGVTADLVVFEGLSHAQYLMTEGVPETLRYFRELSQFFNRYMKAG